MTVSTAVSISYNVLIHAMQEYVSMKSVCELYQLSLSLGNRSSLILSFFVSKSYREQMLSMGAKVTGIE